MNEVDVRILGLYEKIKITKKKTKEWKALAGVSLFFAACYCLGAQNLDSISRDEAIVSNLVWLTSVVAIIIFYSLDARCVKNNKACEIRIYELENEELNAKKEVAEITGERLSDSILNTKIDKPDEKILLPVIYYGVLLGIDIAIRVYLLVNGIF